VSTDLPAQVDVVVIGAGPAGGNAAQAAACRGLTVLLVDKRAEPGLPIQCAEFIPLMMRRYAPEGVLVQEIEGMRTFLFGQEDRWDPFPGLMIDRHALDAGRVAAAVAAGAQLVVHTRFEGFDEEGVVLEQRGIRRTVRAKVVIAADGPKSAVAKALGLPLQPTIPTRQVTVRLLKEYGSTDIFLDPEFAGGYGWLFPRGTIANLGFGGFRVGSDFKAKLSRLIERNVARGLIAPEILSTTGGDIPVGGVRPLVHGHVLLAGDAGGFTHPITGGGIPAALISGQAAGEAAAAWLSGDGEAFTEYAQEMQDHFGPALERAVRRRRVIEQEMANPEVDWADALRRSWIAYPQYMTA